MSLSVRTARAELLALSPCQAVNIVDRATADAAIRDTLHRYGFRGCVAAFAEEMGAHPDTCVARMRWALYVVAVVYDYPHRGPHPLLTHEHATHCQDEPASV